MNIKSFCSIVILFFITFQFQSNAFAHSSEDLKLRSEASILIDATTGTILYSDDSEKLMYPASLTKITTAIIAIEQGNLSDTVTVSKNAQNIEGTRVYLEVGEEVPLERLVYGLLVSSGNDAAIAVAEHFDGSTEAFSKRMNEFLVGKVGVNNTTFRNPHGLFHPEHMTTAYDLAMITKYAMENETFRKIFGTKELKWNGQGWKTTIYNHNQLLWRYEGANGGKTGYVSKSGNTLITTAKRENTELIAVVLKAPSKEFAYRDTTKLFDYGFENYKTNVIPENTTYRNSKNEQFFTTKPLFYTWEKGTDVNFDITEANEIVIKDNDNNVLLQDNSLGIKEVSKNDSNDDTEVENANVEELKNVQVQEPEEKQSSPDLLPIISAMILSLLILGIILYELIRKQSDKDLHL